MIKKLAQEALLEVQTRPCGTCDMTVYNEVFARKIIDQCIKVALSNDDPFTAIDIIEHFEFKNSNQEHTCPFKEDVHGDYETLCDCDDEQTRQCDLNI